MSQQRIVVFGATGTIGQSVVKDLAQENEIIRVGHQGGDWQVDLADKASIEGLFKALGKVDHIISAAGAAAFGPLSKDNDEVWDLSLSNKLMGQINLVRVGMEHLRDGGSITLTAGILSRNPGPGTSAITTANAGLEAFAMAAALEAPRGIRVNVVSPGFIKETAEKMGMPTRGLMDAGTVAESYAALLGSPANGETILPQERNAA
jgi:NAD(P)-dependent dehydrogenase (short-subunit alcohol dehydrogenase family)